MTFLSYDIIINEMWFKLVVMAVLFFVLTPGVVVALPPGASLLTQAAVHSLVFVIVLCVLKHFRVLSKSS
jgi:hypothetical protein